MSTAELEERTKQARREYMRQWRAKNPDKVKAIRERYWLRKAASITCDDESPRNITTPVYKEDITYTKTAIPILCKNLRLLRGGMKQSDFAETIGMSRATVSYYETGSRTPDATVLVNLATAFNVSVDWLLGLSETDQQINNLGVFCEYTGLTKENAMFMHCNPEKAAIANEIIAVFAKAFWEE